MSSEAQLMDRLVRELTTELTASGFIAAEPLDSLGKTQPGDLDPEWMRAWFVTSESSVPNLIFAIVAHVERNDRGGVRIGGEAFVVSSAVEEVLRACEELDYTVGGFSGSEIESIPFGYFEDRADASRKIYVSDDQDVAFAVNKYMDFVRGPVSRWFSERNSIEELLVIARNPYAMHLDKRNPDPMRLRSVVILAILAGRYSDAVMLMNWYIRRDKFHAWDNRGQVVAFDAALQRQYPEYMHARSV